MIFYICESFLKELQEVTKKYDNIEIYPYKAKCKYHHIQNPFEGLNPSGEESYVVGGCSIEQETLPSTLKMQKEESCFHMFAPKTLVEHYLKGGAYLVTPGWLEQWKTYVTQFWGFNSETATHFFGDFCKRIVLLDTFCDPSSENALKEFTSFIAQPYEIVPIGLEYFNLYIDKIVARHQEQIEHQRIQKKLTDAQRNMANYAMAFDLLSKINEKLDEKEIISKIIEIFTILFAPQQIIYLVMKESKVIHSFSSCTVEPDVLEKLASLNENHLLQEDGFIVKLEYDNKTIGIVSVEHVTFAQYITQYLNLALFISGVCALAVENARSDLRTKEVEAQLVQHAKLVAMGEMIGSIAHQWRQPLNALNVNIENLEFDYADGLIDEEFLSKFITEQTDTLHYMSKTIDVFRNFFRIDKVKSPFSIKEAVEKSVTIQSSQLTSNGITLTLTGEDFSIEGFENEFQQVIMNLISNAKDAILEKEVKNGRIDISLSGNTVTVDDNGGGICEEVMDRIFEPYFTTKEQGKGVGMGLYISKMIIEENMGGKIRASNRNDGARFTLELGTTDE